MRRGRPATGAALLLLSAMAAGCASGPAASGTPGGGGAAGGAAAGADGAASSSISRTRPGGLLPGLDRGLRSWQWRIVDSRLPAPLGDLIASVAVPRPEGAGVDQATADRLARNGLRLVAVPRASVDRLRELVVAPAKHVETWHGEAFDWRALALVSPPGDAAAVAIGERVQRYPHGSFRLAARAWTMRMEDGPHLHVELRVDHVAERIDRGLLAGRTRPITRLVDELSIEIAASPDLAWLIVPAAMAETWPDPGTPLGRSGAGAAASRDGGTAGRTAAATDQPEEGEAAEPGDDAGSRAIGPPVSPIPTVGELLLARTTGPGERELIILEPELPRSIFPVAAPVASAASAAPASTSAAAAGGPR